MAKSKMTPEQSAAVGCLIEEKYSTVAKEGNVADLRKWSAIDTAWQAITADAKTPTPRAPRGSRTSKAGK